MADNKDKVKQYGIFTNSGLDGDTRVLHTTTNTYNGRNKSKEEAEEHTRLIKQLNDNVEVLQRTTGSSLNTWKRVDPGTTFGMNPQRTIENMLSVKPGQDVFWFDMENVGTFGGTKDDQLKWYSPTELAIRHSTVNSDLTMTPSKKHMSLLIKPNEDVFQKMNELVRKVENGGMSWRGKLTSDERRTLNDLILYGDSNPVNNGFFKQRGGVTFVQRQNRMGQALDGSIFTAEHIKQMRRGLSNLKDYGTEADYVASTMLNMFKGSKDFMLGGFNIQNYDIPLVNDWMKNDIFGRIKDPRTKKKFETLMNNVSTAKDIDVRQATGVLWKDFGSRIAKMQEGGVLPKKLRQETIAEMLGINTGTAHMGIDDVDTVIKINNHLVKNEGMMEGFKGNMVDRMTATWDKTPFKAGDKMFALSGLAANQAGEHDAVYQLNKETGKLEAAYGMKMNPIFTNNEYQILQEYDGVELGGKKQYGMMMENLDTGMIHFMARETKEEFQNILQQTMLPSEDVFGKSVNAKEKRRDQARRTYSRMFSNERNGGRGLLERMLTGLDALEEGRAAVKAGKIKQSELGLFVQNYNKNGKTTMSSYTERGTGDKVFRSASDAFLRDLRTMENRLRGERPYIEEFLGELDRRMPLKDSGGTNFSGGHNMALQQFRREMDSKFGRNLNPKEIAPGQGLFNVDIDGQKTSIRLKDKKTIESDIRRVVYSGHDGTPSIENQKYRLKMLVAKARTGGASGLTQKEADEMLRSINSLKHGDSTHVIVGELAGRLDAEYKHNQKMGLNTIDIENPTSLTRGRKSKMRKHWEKKGSSIMDRAIRDAQVLDGKYWDNGSFVMQDEQFKGLLDTHNKSLDRLRNQIGADKSNVGFYKAEETLGRLINSFSKDGYKTALIYDAKEKGMVLAMAHEDVAQNVFGLQANEILEHRQVAKVGIPMLDGKGNIVMPGQQRIGRVKAFEDADGRVRLGTAFEEAVRTLGFRANAARRMMGEGKTIEAEKMLRGALRNSVENLSLNNQYMSGADIAKYDERKSKASKWLRSSSIDVTEFAAQWYEQAYADRDIRKKRDRMKRDHLSFFQTLNQDELRSFHRDIGGWLEREKGLTVNFHNVKDTHAANGLRSTNDARSLFGFGYYTPMARENVMKSVNYMPLASNTMEKEALKGVLTNSVGIDKMNRMMNRRFMTDKAVEVLGDEVNWLNVRAAYMDNKQLTSLMKDKGVGNARMSTYDGMFLLSEDVAEAFTITREKKLKLSGGSALDDSISKFLQDAVNNGQAERDSYGNILMKNEVNLTDRRLTDITGRGKDGKITVGTLQTDSIKSLHDNVFVKGWNNETQTLEVETREMMQGTVKMGTTSGHRITATIVSRKMLDDLGIDADMVVEPDSMGKAMHGNMVRSQVDLAVDEIMRQNDEKFKNTTTVGGLKKEQALDNDLKTLKTMMDKHFNTSEAVKLEEGKLIIDHEFGIKNKEVLGIDKLHAFSKEFDSKFKTSFTDNKIRYGVEGLSRADVYDWEDGVGLVEGNRSGLVRYGYKEVDMFEQRANRILGKGNAVTGWLRNHLDDVSKAQNGGGEARDKFIKGVESALLDITDNDLKEGRVKDGEIVIKTNGNTFHETDLQGKRMIRMNNGVTEVSSHAFADVPRMTNRDQKLTVGDLKGTILDLSGTMNGLQTMGPNGQPVDAELGKLLEKNGSVLMELPGQEFSRKYVRMIDTEFTKIGAGEEAMPVLKQLQQSQLKLWRLSKQYQENQDSDTKVKLQGELDNYEKTLGHIYSSSRDGSIADIRSGRLDMSSRFRIQGINPFANKEMGNKYKEGTVYISQGRAEEMISGAERNIAQAVGLDVEGLGDTEVKKKVLDYMSSDGLYSTVNRYPTIAEDTLQVLKLQIDNELDPSHRGGFFTVGTAMRMKADYDGDFFSSVLSHYKYEKDAQGVDAGQIHEAYAQMHKADVEGPKGLNAIGARVVADLESEASGRGLTVGALMKDQEFRESFRAKWEPKVGDIYDRESAIARMGKSDVGILDNLRYKMSNVASATYNTLEGLDGYDKESIELKKRKIDDLGRLFSQDSISAKKFSVDSLTAQYNKQFEGNANAPHLDDFISEQMDKRDSAIAMLKEGLANPDRVGRSQIVQAGQYLGVFNDPDTPGLKDNISSGSTKFDYSVNSMLDELQELHRLSGGSSGNWVNNRYQMLGVSEGDQSPERLSQTIRGVGDQAIATPGATGAAVDGSVMQDTLDRTSSRFKRSVLSNLENMSGGGQAMESTLERSIIQESDGMLSGLTAGERAGAKVSSFINNTAGSMLDSVGGGKGMMMGAGMFGAMWATSALMRGGPTPEGLKQQTQQQPQAVNPLGNQQPTARVTENNGENINIRISAKNAKNMSEQDISALVHQEVAAMTSMQMNVNMNVNDNTQNIDQQWLQGVVANAIDKGFGYSN